MKLSQLSLRKLFLLVLLIAALVMAAGCTWNVGSDTDDVKYYPPGPEFPKQNDR